MGAPKGNQNANGNRGGGRKSAFQEYADAQFLHQIWNGEITLQEVETLLESKQHGARHMFAYKCLIGNDRMLASLTDKLFPKQNVQSYDMQLREKAEEDLKRIRDALISTTK